MSDLHGTLICHSLQQYGWTALMCASMEGKVECVRILLESTCPVGPVVDGTYWPHRTSKLHDPLALAIH